MAKRVENINKDILYKCREQVGMDLLEVKKKVPKIAEIEQGTQKPTFKQLETLAKLYRVPRWVFIAESLPEEYQFAKAVPAFRQFVDSDTEAFDDSKVRGLVARVERFRSLILELREDMSEAVAVFSPPRIQQNANLSDIARQIEEWLNIPARRPDFPQWKAMLEEKGVFIFMTSKYKGWSHIERDLLRGMAIYHSTLPIIIINDSDARKAQSFTLFHELGHLLRKENALDDWKEKNIRTEKWCDKLAGNVLMPADKFRGTVQDVDDLAVVKRIARTFKVSAYACLVRMRQLRIIDQTKYDDYEAQLKKEYNELRKKLQNKDSGPARNRPVEVLNQYGHIYTKALFQAYHNKEIGLHKLSQLFDLKRTSYVLQMEGKL
ncbi:MAG: ImmA/IrrE family metallo-endopeptidase [Anaerohalosphaera sp.]|nr:ImmA/IrrE family metallo-endopeptidase [Anaerohalosphaera sp.]